MNNDRMNIIRLKIIDMKDGNLYHYGHCIHDFIMPVIHYMYSNSIELKHIFLDATLNKTSLKLFKGIAEKILNIKITEYKDYDNLHTLSLPLIKLRAFQFGPYNPSIFTHIVPHIKKTLIVPESQYKIILIERGISPLQVNAGANRRKLANHQRLNKVLSETFGGIFKNVILEETQIEEQISLFMHANIVIGQHGAGLCNIIWMTDPNSLVIEFPPYIVDTFKYMCKAKQIKYIRINPVENIIINKINNHMSGTINADTINADTINADTINADTINADNI